MSKNYLQNAEERSRFLNPVSFEGDDNRRGERFNTSPLSGARFIDIKRIKPDPGQPRKIFSQEALESLAESIKEIGGIIDPLIVEYDDQSDHFTIISGERRYRAAKMVEIEKLPCIIKDVDEKKRLLMQLIANLQREDITPLEEAAGIRGLIERFGYSQTNVAKILNKSRSYVSQILGLERLGPSAREIVQTSELSKEIQIQVSREKDPDRQADLLKAASQHGKTVKQIRAEEQYNDLEYHNNTRDIPPQALGLGMPSKETKLFRQWTWTPEDDSFIITIEYKEDQIERERPHLVREVLKKAYKYAMTLID